MRSGMPIRRVLFILALFVSCIYGSLAGSEDFMNRLPVFNDERCSICHTSSDPSMGSSELNQFGMDFDKNGRVWNKTLAHMDSDNDGYNNGDEIGDPEGDGDTTIDYIRSNPGDPQDKPSSIDKKTWGVIKQLFADS